MVAQPDDDRGVQSLVGLPVAAAVESVPKSLPWMGFGPVSKPRPQNAVGIGVGLRHWWAALKTGYS